MAMTTQPTALRAINADFLTSSYRIVGQATVAGSGLMGLLNDTTNSFVEVQEASMARLHMPNKLESQRVEAET